MFVNPAERKMTSTSAPCCGAMLKGLWLFHDFSAYRGASPESRSKGHRMEAKPQAQLYFWVQERSWPNVQLWKRLQTTKAVCSALHGVDWVGVNNWPAIWVHHFNRCLLDWPFVKSPWLSWKLKGCRRHGTSMKALGTQPWRHVTRSYHVTHEFQMCFQWQASLLQETGWF